MGFGVTVLLPEKTIPLKEYLAFVDDCSHVLGRWLIHEIAPIDPNAGDIVHAWVLLDPTDQRTARRKGVKVWVSLIRDHSVKRYGRSRREIFWKIYTETKAGRNIWSLALQLLIPLKAFNHFPDVVVVVDPERVFLHRKNYEGFVAGELVRWYGAEEVVESKIVMPGSDGPDNTMPPAVN